MPRARVTKHAHKYFRVKTDGKTYWKCTAGDCNHFMLGDLVIGNTSVCSCGNRFTMTRDKMRRRAPKCDECQERKGLRLRGLSPEEKTGMKEAVLSMSVDDLLENLSMDEEWKKGKKS